MSGSRISPVWVVPVEAARAIAGPTVCERLLQLEAQGVDFKQMAMMTALNGRVVAIIDFVRPSPEGKTGLRFQTSVHLRENA